MMTRRATAAISLHGAVKLVEQEGFAILPKAIDSFAIDSLLNDLQHVPTDDAVRRRGETPFGIRNFLSVLPSARQLAGSDEIRTIARAMVGHSATLVRSLFFDKVADANWKVVWHQDRTIAVRRKVDADGFGPWTVKAGVTHVQPPASVLEDMITLRIHLDDTDEPNGALKVIPRSHRLGSLTQIQIGQLTAGSSAVTCGVARGGIMLMRPLLVHSSSACLAPTHRRVIHLEFAGTSLPAGLEWQES